jgi:hypothetical protein
VKGKVIMSKRIMYLRGQNGHPVGCLAIETNKQDSTIKYNMSVLNPEDKFSRALAKQIAEGRLEAVARTLKPSTRISPSGELTVHDVSYAVMNDIVTMGVGQFPARAVKAAKLWIKNHSHLTKMA